MHTGKVELRSGPWEWQELKLQSVPDWETAKRALHFEDPADERNEMQSSVSPDWDLDESEIPAIAASPDWRRVVDSDGVVWYVEPHQRPPIAQGVGKELGRLPRQVYYKGEGGEGLADLPEGLELGDVTHGELLSLLLN